MGEFASSTQLHCDFTAPEVSLDAFYNQETRSTLMASLIAHPDIIRYQALRSDFRLHPSLDEDWNAMAEVEQTALYAAASSIRDSMRYERGVLPWQERPSGDCRAFTWLLSDVVEQLGMASYITYCNGHAFNLIKAPTGQLHMINTESRHMWFFDITGNTVTERLLDHENLMDLQDDVDYVWLTFDAGRLRSIAKKDQPNGRTTYPWLDAEGPAACVMQPEYGKQAIFIYTCFTEALDRGNFKEVSTALEGLRSANPQVETRVAINQDLRKFRSLIRRWRNDSDVASTDLHDMISRYFEVMPQTKSMVVFTADCLRYVGDARADEHLLKQSLLLYQEAAKMGKPNDRTLRAKINKICHGSTEATVRSRAA